MPMANGMTMNGATAAAAGAKKNVLKRKNTQPNVAVPDTRPMKQAAYMSPQNGAMYANGATMAPGGAMYPSAPMQNGNLGGSPQFPSPSTPMGNHLSPYGSYDAAAAQQQQQQQYKRPSSRSDQVRMELRHTVHARQNATSPHPPGGPGALMSPNGKRLGLKKFWTVKVLKFFKVSSDSSHNFSVIFEFLKFFFCYFCNDFVLF